MYLHHLRSSHQQEHVRGSAVATRNRSSHQQGLEGLSHQQEHVRGSAVATRNRSSHQQGLEGLSQQQEHVRGSAVATKNRISHQQGLRQACQADRCGSSGTHGGDPLFGKLEKVSDNVPTPKVSDKCSAGGGAAHRAACVPHNLKTLLYGPFKPGSKLTMPFDETHTGIDSLRGASRAYTVQ